ncbi:MAG: AAA family ATPase [Bacteroidia bacterium]|nr:AAA family ATPase [Bacteroidia bacterium]
MEQLRIRSHAQVSRTTLNYHRDELKTYDWSLRLMGIKGARGIGKTTLMLQHIRQTLGLSEKAIYLSLDDIFFTENKLIDTARSFYQQGCLFFFLDEVHKYPHWATEVKNLYDTYPDIRIVFTGSSILELTKANADLSRRAIMYHLQGLSFRQYLALAEGISLPQIEFVDILDHANEIISQLPTDFRPYAYFRKYLENGYYPFFTEGENWFYDRLSATVRAVLETDLISLQQVEVKNIRKLQQLLYVIASSPPFKPNIQQLSERTDISRNTLIHYLHYLEQADLISLLSAPGPGLSHLQKPEKIFIENTNLIYAFQPQNPNLGAIRETFVLNQLKTRHEVHTPSSGDFQVDGKYHLEVGGKNKGAKQLTGLPHSYVLADDLDFAVGNKIPVWLLGLLY